MHTINDPSNDSSGLSLAVRLQRDSVEAWTDLVELYGPLVASWASQSGLEPAAAEDVVQEVFLSVHRSIARFDGSVQGATFRGWLWRITRNAVLQSVRKPVPSAPGGSSALARLNELADGFADSVLEDEAPSQTHDIVGLLDRAMKQIRSQVEPTTWEAFLQTTVHGRSATEVADSLGISPAAVRKAKSRTLQRLRKQLGDIT